MLCVVYNDCFSQLFKKHQGISALLIQIYHLGTASLHADSQCSFAPAGCPPGDGRQDNLPAEKANLPLEKLFTYYRLFSCGNQMANTDDQR